MENSVLFLGDVYLPHAVGIENRLTVPYVVNLEAPITQSTQPAPGKIVLRVATNHLAESFGSNPIAVNLANNHILDYGDAGFRDTTAALAEEGIAYFGAGREIDNCNNPAICVSGGYRIALLGYCDVADCGPQRGETTIARLSSTQVGEDVQRARKAADRVVVSIHWGKEEQLVPSLKQMRMAGQMMAQGADLIIGHHPHVIQPVVDSGGRTIAFSLGNFVFLDLVTASYYNEVGEPTAMVRKRQAPWNRSSLGILYDAASQTAEKIHYRFAGETVREGKTIYSRVADWRIQEGDLGRYAKWQTLKDVAGLFHQAQWRRKPRLPRKRTIQRLWRILRGRGE